MNPGEAVAAIRAALERLPPAVGEALGGLDLTVAERPGPGALAAGVPATTAGVFMEPDPRTLEPTDDDEPPAPAGRIVLYLANIDPCDAPGVVAIFLHEAAHALGLDDPQLEAAGL